MAYENESFQELCDRIVGKLRKECKKTTSDGDCLARKVDFEDRCTLCQAAGLIFFTRDEVPGLARKAAEVDRLRSFQINALGGYG